MSSTVWLHCNKCFKAYSKNDRFFITNCNHVFCSSCASQTDQTKNCILCKCVTNVEVLGRETKAEKVLLFKDLSQQLRSYARAVKFQKAQMKSFGTNLDQKGKSLKAAVETREKHYLEKVKQIKQLKEKLGGMNADRRDQNANFSPQSSVLSLGPNTTLFGHNERRPYSGLNSFGFAESINGSNSRERTGGIGRIKQESLFDPSAMNFGHIDSVSVVGANRFAFNDSLNSSNMRSHQHSLQSLASHFQFVNIKR